MKNIIVVLALIISSNFLFAQSETKSLPLSIGYFSNYGFQPGVKIGTQFHLKNWESEHEGKKGNFTKSKSYFINPQIGFYSWIGNDINFLLNTEIGYQRIKSSKNTFSAISIGLGYLAESEVIAITYNLSDGSIKEKNRELRNHFLTTINYEFGKAINSKLAWYGKPSLGWKLSNNSSMVVLIEAGLKFNFKK